MDVKELLKLTPQKIDPDITFVLDLLHCNTKYQYKIPEPNLYNLHLKVIKHHYYDHRRCWFLALIMFKDSAVAVVQKAGREGDDYNKIYVLNKELYIEMCHYIDIVNPIDIDTDELREININEDLTYFYDQSLNEPFNYYY